MKIAGLDIGTTGCKITMFDEKGNYLDKAYQDYPVSSESNQGNRGKVSRYRRNRRDKLRRNICNDR